MHLAIALRSPEHSWEVLAFSLFLCLCLFLSVSLFLSHTHLSLVEEQTPKSCLWLFKDVNVLSSRSSQFHAEFPHQIYITCWEKERGEVKEPEEADPTNPPRRQKILSRSCLTPLTSTLTLGYMLLEARKHGL